MITFLKGLFDTNGDKILDMASGVGGWIDGQQFTEQEKAEANLKLLEHQLKWLSATQGMNLARRWLALMFCSTFLFTFILCVLLLLSGTLFEFRTDQVIMNVIKLAESFQIGWITLAIIGFYFGKGMLEGKTKK